MNEPRKMTRAEAVAKAHEGARRKRQERMAAELRDLGWTVSPPQDRIDRFSDLKAA